MYLSSTLLVLLSLLSLSLSLTPPSSSPRLIYMDKPSGDVDGINFVASLSKSYEVKGDFGNFILLVDYNTKISQFQKQVVVPNYNPYYSVYLVLEFVEFSENNEIKPVMSDELLQYDHVVVKDKFVFTVPREEEQEFKSLIPIGIECTTLSQNRLSGPVAQPLNHAYPTVNAPDPVIEAIIAQVNSADIRNFVTYLTGENPASTILTRQAQSTGAQDAQTYLVQQYTSFGFQVTTQPFMSGYSSNVIATLPGTVDPTKLVLITAHYDSRGPNLYSTTARAPGANDNGSGTGALLEIARVISDNKLSFAYTVVIIGFSGEEMGLYGSAFSAQQYKAAGANIIAVLNADMIAYRVPTESPQLAFAARASTPALNTLLADIATTYVSALTVGTSNACCTDHSSFYNEGFPAASFFERNGGIADPQYHQAGDLVNRVGYDIDNQYPLITQAILASVLTIAEYQPL